MPEAFDALTDLFAPDATEHPDPAFVERLRNRVVSIERRTTHQAAIRSQPTKEIPMTQPTLIPYITVTNARAALEFYKEVFGAEVIEDEYYEMEDGRLGHVSMKIGEGTMYMSDEYPELGVQSPETLGGAGVSIVINVADADATFNHAIEAGATMQRPVENAHGGRSGWLVDPWGHRWSPFGPETP